MDAISSKPWGMAAQAALGVLAAVALTFATSTWSTAAPRAELWERWSAHDPDARTRIDHGAWDSFLKRFVRVRPDGANLVAYGKVTRSDKAELGRYLGGLAALPISTYNRAEQLAYWINLYNAITVWVILEHYPVAGIRDIDISPGWFTDGPWGKKLVTIEGQAVSLDDIEHRILRPIWRDPRIHYAVNCASIGCPDLTDRAVTATTAEAYLDEGARAYVNDARGAQIRGGQLYVSSLYRWFEADFAADGGIVAHLRKYAGPDLANRLRRSTTIADDSYDWRLNDASPRRVRVRRNTVSEDSYYSGGS